MEMFVRLFVELLLYVVWWKGVMIYQIYLCSYVDFNGDGIGDLLGIIVNFEYIVELGVDVIWILFFYKFLMVDFGYDVLDFCDVDLIFGMLDDFDVLMVCVYVFGLKVIIDQVYFYVLDQYEWFQVSRLLCDNDKVDWFVWVDVKLDGLLFINW